ncbi:MAG TPA: AMP-binding protein [Symbiobacteriaceae bacterium]|nr:AMP-binding protein [Symbiobacteriaceae bacterium]
MAEPIWQPTAAEAARARITAFMRRCGVDSLETLHLRVQADPAWFWEQVVADLGIAWYEPPRQTLDLTEGIAWPRWFRGARLNLANDCLDKHIAAGRGDRLAVVYEGEDGQVRRWSYQELWAESNRLAGGLRALGVGRGDRVGIWLPMLPETVAAMLAVAKLGAVFTPIFSGFAAPAAASRLAGAGARVLITADGFARRGAIVPLKERAGEAAALAGCVERLVVVRRTGRAVPWDPGRDVWYHDLTGSRIDTERMEPDDPFMIIYTSGTTGRPKGAVHVHGGFPLKAAQEMAHCFDLHANELMFWYSDPGWMIAPWLVFGTLMLGAAMFLYDGAPDCPQPDRLWAMVDRHRITHLGLAPTVIRGLAAQGDRWPARHGLSSLRILAGAGEPWHPEPYLWYFRNVGRGRCPILNYSGGTEVSGGILGTVVTRPIKACSFNTVVPGMAPAVLDDQGRPAGPGQVGELCLTIPWVGMTRGFWQDPARYEAAYWSRFAGVWVHGDLASVDDEGYWYIHGRSDDTIKLAGKRAGPAEFETALMAHPSVAEAAAVGIPHPVKGEVVACFAVLRPGEAGGADLAAELQEWVARELGRPLTPDAVWLVGALPRTRTGKVMRRVIRAAYLGLDPGDLSSLENPEAVGEIASLRR